MKVSKTALATLMLPGAVTGAAADVKVGASLSASGPSEKRITDPRIRQA